MQNTQSLPVIKNTNFFSNNWFYQVLAVICVGMLLVLLSWVYFSDSEFPYLNPGVYVGSIVDTEDSGLSEAFVLYKNKNSQIFTHLARPSWPVLVNTQTEELRPLVLEYNKNQLRFVGVQHGQSFSGSLTSSTGSKASWKLSSVVEFSDHNVQDLKPIHYLMDLVSEYTALQVNIASLTRKIELGGKELQDIESHLSDTRVLKQKGDAKFQLVKAEYDQTLELFRKKQNILKALESKMFLSQRVTSRGKLVSLARETLQRERRWVESIARSSMPGRNHNMVKAYERGRRILVLRDLIDTERSQIYRLQRIYDRRQGRESSSSFYADL